MKKHTLFVLAAGMGSRYGGLKQLDTMSDEGDTIIDFSLSYIELCPATIALAVYTYPLCF